MPFSWKKAVLATILAYAITSAACTTTVPVPPHDLKSGTPLSICQLLQAIKSPDSLPQSVIIHGKVTDMEWCPPCPKGFRCSDCPQEHIVMEAGGCSIIILGNFHDRMIVQYCYCVSLAKGESTSDYPYHPYRITGWKESPDKGCVKDIK